MDLPVSESPTHPEEKRPVSCKFVELHVLYVPNDQWNVKLNKVPVEAIHSFVSGGFIRVYPDVTLKSLRRKLSTLQGGSLGSIDKFFFLKCVGHSLALVKTKQERDVKVKTFAPPYAPQPELYLLRLADSDDSVWSQSLTPDSSSSSDQNSYYPYKTCPQPTGSKEQLKLPHITNSSHQAPPNVGVEDDNREEEQGYSSSEAESPEKTFTSKLNWVKMESYPHKSHPQCSSVNNNLQECKTDSISPSLLTLKGRICRKTKLCNIGSQTTQESGMGENLEDRHSDFSIKNWHGKSKESCAVINKSKKNNQLMDSPTVSSQSLQHTSTIKAQNESGTSDKDVESPNFRTNKQELIEEIKMVREERKQLEWMRQELLRKGKDLLAQNRHRRNQARDSWKKKYFETKKATAPLEESLRKVRQDLETFYSKLLHQLHARENRGNPKRQGRTSVKNELIIQIMTESYEIEDLKRKVEDGKMKLQTEIKLRKQAATELKSLKAELAQKKSQSSPPRTVAYLGFGNTPTPQNRAHKYSSSVQM
ncbi:spermatogenesis-associated protein 1 [Boleophthalmus pectinirostris]|uniref:spermatogenesis-associated protein 1 n=1 Tax=Boleophthalmus pectinirostris TaxID=150288 RepID=UPI0024304540|nr:spermatogenesis-associated protein 1 [Boleophthalmus pectinirostris]